MIWSKQTPMKSTNISSAIGRRPQVAAPDGGADDGRFADRRIQHPVLAEARLQALGDAHVAAPGILLAGGALAAGDVLAQHDDALGSSSMTWRKASDRAWRMVENTCHVGALPQ